MQTFQTLLKREWMQHRLGWLLLGGVPFAIMLPLMSFGSIQFGDGAPPPPGLVALIIAFGYIYFLLILAGGAIAIQTPGLARRDRQDRSVEFWLSLPIGHSEAIGATVLMHLLVMPLLLLALAAAGSPIAALIAELRVHGSSAFVEMPWITVATVFAVGLLRLALGIVLGMLWLSPLLLAAMAASAWLKRWGVPALLAVFGLGGLILDKGYGQPIVFDLVAEQFANFGRAVVPLGLEHLPGQSVPGLSHWLWHDTLGALGDLANLHFVGGLVVAAACFGLLVWRRATH
jgi:ABC-2 type transport system permease protein